MECKGGQLLIPVIACAELLPAFFQDLQQFLGGKVQLPQVIIGAQLHGLFYHIKFLVAADHDDPAVRILVFQMPQDPEPVDLRNVQVQEDDIRTVLPDPVQRLFPIRRVG